jgi:hypothetical protein
VSFIGFLGIYHQWSAAGVIVIMAVCEDLAGIAWSWSLDALALAQQAYEK